MEIVEIDRDRIDEIGPLWEELNYHHRELSENFKDHFANFKFSDRSQSLLKKEYLAIFVAKDKAAIVGYCIATCNQGIGEIDSLYVKSEYQGASLGMKLTEKAMAWLRGFNCSQINVSVAEGNESAIHFYEKLGFRKRFYVLQIKNS